MDLELSRVPALREWFAPRLHTTLLPTMAALFGVAPGALVAQEVFCVKYDATGARGGAIEWAVGSCGTLPRWLVPVHTET